ncbi:MAG: glycosyltransferase family 87 protein [Pseudomonadota bacterium]
MTRPGSNNAAWPGTGSSRTRSGSNAIVAPLVCLGLMVAGLAWLSSGFPYGAAMEATPWAPYITLAILAGIVFLWLVSRLRHQPSSARLLFCIFGVGLALRLAMFSSTPVFEDDWYRYLWDGASLAAGIDPYSHPPAAAAPVDAFGAKRPLPDDPNLAVLQTLAAENAEAHRRINYPYLSTIYPPIAQAAFALSATVAPFSFTAWRGVLLLSDLAAFFILLQVLRIMGRPLILSAIYWLNPLIILQVFGAGHMDGLLVAPLLAALWMTLSRRPGFAGTALSLAVGVKLWPIVLFPALAMGYWRDWPALLRLSAVFAGLVALVLLPQVFRAIQPDDGLGAYSTSWQTHAFLFPLISNGLFGWLERADTLARLVIAGTISTVAIATALGKGPMTGERLVFAWLIVIGALIFLSPTGYPWYLVWTAPLLPLIANRGLLFMSVTWPLYYFRFVLGDGDTLYLWLIVPTAFLPALYFFVRDALFARPRP